MVVTVMVALRVLPKKSNLQQMKIVTFAQKKIVTQQSDF